MRSLQPRERFLLTIAAVAIGILLVYLVIFRGYIGGMKSLEKKIEQKQSELKSVESMWEEYQTIKDMLPSLESRLAKKDFSLLTELENLSMKARVKGNVDSMQEFTRPQNEFYKESSVRVKLKGITLDQLVSYLYNIEHANTLLRAKSLVAERSYTSPELLDVQLEVSTFFLLSQTQSPSGGKRGAGLSNISPTTK